MVYVGETGKILSVWTSCCSKNSVTALLCIKLINGNSCSNNLPVKTESVQESWQSLHNQQDSNSQHCKQLDSVNKTLCNIIVFTKAHCDLLCIVQYEIASFSKISHQSFTHTTRHSAKTHHRGVIFNYKHKRYYNKQKLQPGKCLTGQNKIKNKNKNENKNDLWFLNQPGRRVGRGQPVAEVNNYIERYYLSRIVYDDRVRL